MSYSQVIVLAIVQALTEFLPVSSSGHLVIFQKLFGISEPPVFFDVLVHLGTLGTVLFYFRQKLLKIVRGLFSLNSTYINICRVVVVGTIPAAVGGLFLQKYIEQIFNSLKLVGISLLATSGLLLSTKLIENKRFKSLKSLKDLGWLEALLIGIFQALALLPGMSRSGVTITAGLHRRLDRPAAFYLSFYLAIPAIIGATVLQLPKVANGQFSYLSQAFLGMLVAGLTGYFALKFLERVLLGRKLWLFGVYCFVLGLVLLIL